MFEVCKKELCSVVKGTFPARVVAVGRWQCRWFNRDYRSRMIVGGAISTVGSPHHTREGNWISAADQDRKEMQDTANTGVTGGDWWWGDNRGHGAISDGLFGFSFAFFRFCMLFTSSCCSLKKWNDSLIHYIDLLERNNMRPQISCFY